MAILHGAIRIQNGNEVNYTALHKFYCVRCGIDEIENFCPFPFSSFRIESFVFFAIFLFPSRCLYLRQCLMCICVCIVVCDGQKTNETKNPCAVYCKLTLKRQHFVVHVDNKPNTQSGKFGFSFFLHSMYLPIKIRREIQKFHQCCCYSSFDVYMCIRVYVMWSSFTKRTESRIFGVKCVHVLR